MDILIQDVRFALRSLRRSPGFVTVVVAVLALGIGVNTMIFSMVYGLMARPWPLPHFDRVMTIVEKNKKLEVTDDGVSWLNFQDFRHEVKSFESIGGYWTIRGQVVIDKEPEMFDAAQYTAGLMPALGMKPQIGRNFTEDENVYDKNWSVVMISDRIWRRRYGGTQDVLGKTLRINGRPRTIIGVLPPGFRWPETSDFVIPAAISPDDSKERGDHNLSITARLEPGVSKQQADAEIASIYARLRRDNPAQLKDWT